MSETNDDSMSIFVIILILGVLAAIALGGLTIITYSKQQSIGTTTDYNVISVGLVAMALVVCPLLLPPLVGDIIDRRRNSRLRSASQ
jgi:flagellar basal body-associated protein FliL